MAGASEYHDGNALFVDEDYAGAFAAYSRALEAEPSNADYYGKRAAAHMRLGNFVDAVADVTKSLKAKPSAKGFLRKGEALFKMEDYDEALLSFRKGLDLEKDSVILRRWIRKCEAELADPVIVSPLVPVGPATFSTEAAPAAAQAAVPPSVQAGANAAPAVPTDTSSALDPRRVRHEWYQTPTHVVISILARGATGDAVTVNYERTSVDVTIKAPGSHSEYQLSLSLFAPIDASASAHTVGATKVEIKLKKLAEVNWDTLEGDGEGGILQYHPERAAAPSAPVAAAGSAPRRPAYPTSNPRKVNWDEVEKDVKRTEEEEKLEGDEALQKLFRDIYARSDEDTRRAMNKSFQTSGGTVLSTNWGEVKDKDYEKDRTAPEGQEWKTWG